MLFVWIWSKKRSDRSDRQLKCSAWTQRGASTQNVINEIWNLIKKNKQMQVVRGEKKIIKCFSSVLSLWWHIRQIQFLFFMCRISKCHINSWLLLFLAARGQFCFIWPFALLPHQHHHLVHSLSLALIHSPSSVRWGAPCPVLWQACQACIWPSGVQCWEAASSVRRASGLHRVSPSVFLFLSLWLVVGLLGAQASPYHPAPATPDLTTAGGADTHTRAHTNCPFARCSHSTTFGSAVSCATIDPWLHLSVWIDSSRGTLRLSHSVVFNIRADGRSGSPLFSHFCNVGCRLL